MAFNAYHTEIAFQALGSFFLCLSFIST